MKGFDIQIPSIKAIKESEKQYVFMNSIVGTMNDGDDMSM